MVSMHSFFQTTKKEDSFTYKFTLNTMTKIKRMEKYIHENTNQKISILKGYIKIRQMGLRKRNITEIK